MHQLKRAYMDIQREHMGEFGHEIEWLANPAIIPEHAIHDFDLGVQNPYFNLAMWMIEDLMHWGADTHEAVDYKKICEQYGVPEIAADFLKGQISGPQDFGGMYSPGILSMTEIFDVVPYLAVREGIDDHSQWGAISSDARKFAGHLARKTTFAQMTVREYLGYERTGFGYRNLSPEKLRLDEHEGIEGVIPISDTLEMTLESLKKYFPKDTQEMHLGPTVCPALYARVKGLDNIMMFDAVWNAFGAAAETYIHPLLNIDPDTILAQKVPDLEFARRQIDTLALQSYWQTENHGLHTMIDEDSGSLVKFSADYRGE